MPRVPSCHLVVPRLFVFSLLRVVSLAVLGAGLRDAVEKNYPGLEDCNKREGVCLHGAC